MAPNHASSGWSTRWDVWKRRLTGLVFPAACVACGLPFGEAAPPLRLCPECQQSMRTGYDFPCPRCAMPLPQAALAAGICGECHKYPHRFAAAVALGTYDGPLRQWVLRAKSHLDDALALTLGRMLGQTWSQRQQASEPPLDAVIAVPAPRLRSWLRASNLAETLAEAVSRELCVPSITGTLQFVRGVKKQTGLRPARRRRNMRGALRATSEFDLRGANLLVVDDVLTTGATADECARALLAAGAARVSLATIARASGYG